MRTEQLILLAEDNALSQKVTSLFLELQGYKVRVAGNGKEAVAAIEDGDDFIVVLMDCMMPEMDGFQATRSIRELEKYRNRYTPIIAVTSMGMSGDFERCLQAGMDDYIPKPVNRDILSIKIHHWSLLEPVSRNRALTQRALRRPCAVFDSDAPIDLIALSAFYERKVLRNILQLFLSSTPALLLELQVAINSRNACNTIRLAHELNASSTTLGATDLAKLSMCLQDLARTRNWHEIEQTTPDITISFGQVRQLINREMEVSAA